MPTGNHATASAPAESRAADAPSPEPTGRSLRTPTSAGKDGEPQTAALIARLRKQLGSSETAAAVSKMTAGVAHELHNPLTALLASLSQMRDLLGGDDAPKSPEDVAQLRTALLECVRVADRMKDLVGAVRSINRRDHRNAVFFDPARTIRNAAKIFAVVHHAVCRVDVSIGALPALHGSPAGLGQVVLALLQNGLDASLALQREGHARLTVVATATASEVQICVSDEGAGIADEIAPRVFEEFFTTKESGSGLGLHLSRQIVAEMRGAISFERVSDKTVFTIRVPFGD